MYLLEEVGVLEQLSSKWSFHDQVKVVTVLCEAAILVELGKYFDDVTCVKLDCM